jgi:hypothetical protein
MTIEVYGLAPTGPRGTAVSYQNRVWRGIIAYLHLAGPRCILSKCEDWTTADEGGLSNEDALALGEWLNDEIMSGRTAGALSRWEQTSEYLGRVWTSEISGEPLLEELQELAEFLCDCGGFVIT